MTEIPAKSEQLNFLECKFVQNSNYLTNVQGQGIVRMKCYFDASVIF